MHDLLVIGGGPAGATCARRAAEGGLDVVLIEKDVHPRDKPCGGALSPRAIELLGFDIKDAIERVFHAALVYTPTGKKTILTRDGFEACLVNRSEFDRILLERARQAGVEVVQGTKIVAIEQLRKGIRALSVGDSYKGHLLVGADGVNGITGRRLGIRKRWEPKSVALCLNAEFPAESADIESVMTIKGYEQNVINLFYGLVNTGYGWCFPKRESLNIGIGCRMDSAANLRYKWNSLIKLIERSKNIKLGISKKTSARVPLGGWKDRVIARRAMLIGDAAGLVSPVSGEGISYAIESGLLAAEIACETVAEESPLHLMEYEQRLRHGLVRELKTLRTFARVIYRTRGNIDLLCGIAESDSVIREYMTDILARTKPDSDIMSKIRNRMLLRHPVKSIRLGLL
jgi:geranylgeranyl reductase family protein